MQLRIAAPLAALAAAFALSSSSIPVAAQTPALIEISVTSVGPGAPEWGIYIGEERGFFAKAGLHVTESTAGNTQNAVSALVTGDAPLAILASDIIVVANAHSLPIKYIAPLVTIPTYALVVRPEIFDVYAQRQGMHVLARARDVVKDWVSNGLAVNPKWAEAHHADLVRFLRALRVATQYGYDHPDDAVAIMAAKMHMQPADAQITYDADTSYAREALR
jgi:ABC-type nitrate/sulfonate/bicarbonate transport system substrate-binding protein